MKPVSKAEASWKYWREDNPPKKSHPGKFTLWCKQQMRKARRRYFKDLTKETRDLLVD